MKMRDPTMNGEAQIDADDRRNGAQLDKAGQSILRLLHEAAGMAEQNSRHAVEAAQKLSHQLRAAQDRVNELAIRCDRPGIDPNDADTIVQALPAE
jgi:hypothetical protein